MSFSYMPYVGYGTAISVPYSSEQFLEDLPKLSDALAEFYRCDVNDLGEVLDSESSDNIIGAFIMDRFPLLETVPCEDSMSEPENPNFSTFVLSVKSTTISIRHDEDFLKPVLLESEKPISAAERKEFADFMLLLYSGENPQWLAWAWIS